MKKKVGKQHCLPFCWFKPVAWYTFEKGETSEKGCIEIEDWGISAHFVLGCKENSIYTLDLF